VVSETWDAIANWIIAGATILLVISGGLLAYHKRSAGVVTAVLGAAIVFALLLTFSRYQDFEGYGVTVHMWKKEQVEAAELISRLKYLSESNAQQSALVAARVGYSDSAFSNVELMNILTQTEATLRVVNTPEAVKQELTAPIIERVKLNYIAAAKTLVDSGAPAGGRLAVSMD
jgi:hypothetical protein